MVGLAGLLLIVGGALVWLTPQEADHQLIR
jgi:hypothetical protein